MLFRDSTTRQKLALLICVLLSQSSTARVIYVDDDAPGANNGSSWPNAYVFLQDAIAGSRSGDEIRVAQGTYRPDRGAEITLLNLHLEVQLVQYVPVH